MRTQEQIIADCERRFQELQEEKRRLDENPQRQRPCETCKWYSDREDNDGRKWYDKKYREYYATCHEPLVKGFRRYGKLVRLLPMPCGPEKALWKPKPTLIERIVTIIETMLDNNQ